MLAMTEDTLLPFDLPAVQRKNVTADFEDSLISSGRAGPTAQGRTPDQDGRAASHPRRPTAGKSDGQAKAAGRDQPAPKTAD